MEEIQINRSAERYCYMSMDMSIKVWKNYHSCTRASIDSAVSMFASFFLSGGYTVGPKPLIDLLRQRSRPYLFSNSLPPPVVGSATRAVELLLASNEIAQSMAAKTMR